MLKKAESNIDIPVEDPERIVYLLRQAAGDPRLNGKYNWITKTYIIKIRYERISFKRKTPKLPDILSDVVPDIQNVRDLLELVQIIIKNKPSSLTITHNFTVDEQSRLENVMKHYEYKYELTPTTLRFYKT